MEQMEKILLAIDRLAAYEDAGLTPEEINELLHQSYGPLHKKLGQWIAAEKDGRLAILPPNDPLTMEELREMDEEPVWVERCDGAKSRWAIFGDMLSPYGVYFGTGIGGLRLSYEDYGKTWMVYRRRPEEETA